MAYTPPKTIPQEDLIVRRVYLVQARNLLQAVWNGKDFLGIREKFGSRFIDGCEIPYGTCFPLEDMGIDVPENIPVEEYLRDEDGKLLGNPKLYGFMEALLLSTETRLPIERDPDSPLYRQPKR